MMFIFRGNFSVSDHFTFWGKPRESIPVVTIVTHTTDKYQAA